MEIRSNVSQRAGKKKTPQPETHFYEEVQPFIANVDASQTSITNQVDSGQR